MSDNPSDSLLNAMDGIARYEAQEELKRRDPAEVIPHLLKMLEEGTARYPHEIVALVGAIGQEGAVEPLLNHPDKSIRRLAERTRKQLREPASPGQNTTGQPPPALPRERSPEDEIERLARYVGVQIKTMQPYERSASRKLLEIGAPAVPALVKRLHDRAARINRFAVLQLLGEMAEQGITGALDALKTACDDPDPSIARPAQVVLEKLDAQE
jgi:HEAT repeat protein